MFFVNECHKNGLGVILDWVPGHFCKDGHGLYRFDGSFLFEYPHEQDRENPVWGTSNFNLARNEVKSFIISNAIFWIEYFHIDGFRVDAVANLIYWPNQRGKPENRDGIEFLKKLNRVVFQYDPSILIFAGDSTDWPLVTSPVHDGGLGWKEAWEVTTKSISYTNHTTLQEALEKWAVRIFQPLLPRIYMIVNEINERFCRQL